MNKFPSPVTKFFKTYGLLRIMKSKKTVIHNDLVTEVFNDLKLPISISDIKKKIESLIERDHLSRDKDNMQFYLFILYN